MVNSLTDYDLPGTRRVGLMLTRFFVSGRSIAQSRAIQTQLSGCVISQEDFFVRMRQERLRSERYGTPLSLIVLDIKELMKRVVNGNGTSGTTFFRYVAEILKNSTREYDIKGWYQEGEAGILTPNTDESGARALARKLITGLADRFGFGANIGERDLGRLIRISSLPTHNSCLAAGGDEDEAKPAPPFAPHYRLSFPSADSRTLHYASVKGRGTDVAVMTWPIAIELLTQEQAQKLQLKLKRAMDVLGSLLGIVLFGPLMFLIALVIKISSPGPVLFRQKRLGLLGKPFTFLKFRSMKINSDHSIHREYVTKLINGENGVINNGTTEQPVYKINNDPRVTWIGRLLRKSSLDELPQFFNVLKGDMSLVGPRPPIRYEYDSYQRWHCRRVLEVKPGITGLWQVSGRSRTTFNEMVRLDLTYARTWNLWLDVRILAKTLWTVVSTKGGY
jgi:lipopolysaccharide/colanic/teichoic acid biosynthesis glycosyltransferase/GGDEF domain-containing protein